MEELIERLKEFHPGQIQSVNPKIASYTGGMEDDGELNYKYLHEEATVEEIVETLRTLEFKFPRSMGI